jgi:hypothetical protein
MSTEKSINEAKGNAVLPLVTTRFLLLSLKWTNKKDNWFTFWREKSAGYCWFKDWAGLYDIEKARETHGHDNTIMVDSFLIKHLWKEIEYEGKKREILPNTEEVREALSIQLRDLKALHRTAY